VKILLIVPTHQYIFRYPAYLSVSDFPAGFAYLAASLKKSGHDVFGCNPNNDTSYSSAASMVEAYVRKSLIHAQPELIGLGGLCTDYAFIKHCIAIIRSFCPNTPVVMGGGIINHDGEFMVKTLRPDFALWGDSEETLVALVDMLQRKESTWETIPHLWYWSDNVLHQSTAQYTPPDLDRLPWPDYDLFDIERMHQQGLAARYLYRYTRPKPRIMTLVAARGCPFKCTFCVHSRDGKSYGQRSVDNVINEIRYHYDRHPFNILVILDELFAANKKWFNEFCSKLINERTANKWDFDWLFQTHANVRLDIQSLRLAKEAGCYFFSYGMESASPPVLLSMNKKTSPDQLSDAIKLARQVPIGFGGNFIFGDIAETPETVSETLAFYSNYCRDMHVFLGEVLPYPGSQLFDYCLNTGLISDKLDYYETIEQRNFNLTSIPPDEWKRILSKIYFLATFPEIIETVALNISYISANSLLDATKERAPISGTRLNEHKKTPCIVMSIDYICPHCMTRAIYNENISAIDSMSVLTAYSTCHLRFKIRTPKLPPEIWLAIILSSDTENHDECLFRARGLLQELRSGRRQIIAMPAGLQTQEFVLKTLSDYDLNTTLLFDNDSNKEGTIVRGLKVCKPDLVAMPAPHPFIFVSLGPHQEAISAQLQSLGLRELADFVHVGFLNEKLCEAH
jgi:anaerobic magnesium-protoporphyrin IX monomethyl ester cyclase